MYRVRRLLVLVVLLSTVALLGGCAMPLAKKKGAGGPPSVAFRFVATKGVNDGRSVRGFVRPVTEQEFVSDTYQKMVDLAFAVPPDPSVVPFMLLPGKKLTFRMEKDKTRPLAIYTFFSNPSDQWKLLIPQPLKHGYKFQFEKCSLRQR